MYCITYISMLSIKNILMFVDVESGEIISQQERDIIASQLPSDEKNIEKLLKEYEKTPENIVVGKDGE